ncbi:hypothetical protein AT15_06355 [Kosmotoga arenicorallina S304]|uniref:Uncharacterized protein n=1 Tax=Kosmotoga arenicorallina S304 TaxID=1453497 RepID=A0A176JTP9_9BACT|nr:hypothetical protein AT15_06355 [Kosmotoga arenicorallina S304]
MLTVEFISAPRSLSLAGSSIERISEKEKFSFKYLLLERLAPTVVIKVSIRKIPPFEIFLIQDIQKQRIITNRLYQH